MAEVMIALGIVAFSLVPILAMLPLGLASNHNTVQQTEAANLIAVVEADLRSAPKGATTTPIYNISIPGILATGTTSLYFKEDATVATAPGEARYKLTLTFAAVSGKNATPVHLLAIWPPQGSKLGSVESIATLNRN